jgi:hypothetical protein
VVLGEHVVLVHIVEIAERFELSAGVLQARARLSRAARSATLRQQLVRGRRDPEREYSRAEAHLL